MFIPANTLTKYDKCPFVLIDVSGSTSSQCNITEYQSILGAEIKIAYFFLREKEISECHLLFWNDKVRLNQKISTEALNENYEACYSSYKSLYFFIIYIYIILFFYIFLYNLYIHYPIFFTYFFIFIFSSSIHFC
jgi:hypothetical protein